MRLIALGCAVTALALVTAGIVFTRCQSAPPSAAVEDHRVAVQELLKISGSNAELVLEGGVARGMRITDPELARALSVGPKDVIVAVSGIQIRDPIGPLLMRAVSDLALLHVTMLYVELERDHRPVLARWSLDLGLGVPAVPPPPLARPSLGTSPPDLLQSDPVPPDPLNDPVFDTIRRIDDTHYEIPRSTIEHIFGNLAGVLRTTRVVPAVKNGVPLGFKLFAIRPGSLFAKLGMWNGDLVRGINGEELTTPDKVIGIFVKARSADQFTIELERRGYPLFLHVVVK